MRAFLSLLILLSVGAQTGRAAALTGHTTYTPPSTICAMGTTLGDGCPAAPTTGSFQNPTLLQVTAASGQQYPVRPPWNLAGGDYPVGYDTTQMTPGSAAADPFGVRMPTDCVKLTTPDTYSPPAVTASGYLKCTSTTGSIDFENFDFGEHGCTAVVLLAYTGTVTGNNSRLASGAGCAGGTAQFYMVNASGKNPALVLTHDEFDGRQAYNVSGSIGNCTGTAPNVNCVLTISSMTGSFNVGDMFDDVAQGSTGSGLSTTPVVWHGAITSGAPGSCATSSLYYCGAGSYNISYFYQTSATTDGTVNVTALGTAQGTTCSQTTQWTTGTACQNIVGLQNGMDVTGPCIAAGTKIVGLPTVTTVTLSLPTTCSASGSSNTITFSMPAMSVSFSGGMVGNLTPVVVDYSATGSTTTSYNYIHDTPIRPLNFWANGALQFDHNYCTNMGTANSWSTQHGECFDVTAYTGAPSPNTLGSWSVTYNTFVYGTAPTSLYAAWIYTGNSFNSGAGYFIFPHLLVDHNTDVGNCALIGSVSTCLYANGQYTGTNGNGLLTISRNQFSDITLTNNYVDTWGQSSCVVSSADVKTFRGTINNGSGGAGTLLTITSNNIAIPVNDTIGDLNANATGILFTTVTGANTTSTLTSGGSGYQVGDVLTLSNGAVETVSTVTGSAVATYTQTTAPTAASGPAVQVTKSVPSLGRVTGGSGPLFNFSGAGNTVNISQNATTGTYTWAAYTPMGDLSGTITVSGNVNMADGTSWGAATPYLQGVCNLYGQGPP